MIDYYNRISNIVSTAIVSESKVRSRAKLLEKVINIAEVISNNNRIIIITINNNNENNNNKMIMII